MFERVLVAVDGSRAARAAAALAVRLAREREGAVHACYVVDRGEVAASGSPVFLRGEVKTELERVGRRALARVASLGRSGGVPCTQAVVDGTGGVPEAIAAEARRFRANVIVMGTEGHGRVRAFLLGSRAQEMLSRAPCPVLLVPSGTARRAGAAPRARPRRRTARRRTARRRPRG